MSLTTPTRTEIGDWAVQAIQSTDPKMRAEAVECLLMALAQQTEAAQLLAREVQKWRPRSLEVAK